MKPKEFMGQKVYYEGDLRLRGWKLVEYITSYTNGVSLSTWCDKSGKQTRMYVY